MNLHSIVAPIVGAVNPLIPVSLHISTGTSVTAPNGSRTPLYATPGALTGSIAGTVLTVSAIASGQPQAGQTLTGGSSPLLPGTLITGQLTGSPGGVGDYSVNREQIVGSQAISTAAIIMAQVQPLTYKDLMLLDGLNQGGQKMALYTNGDLDGVIRVQVKGGDLIDLPNLPGFPGSSRWLVTQQLEGWVQTAGWTKVAMVLQNGS